MSNQPSIKAVAPAKTIVTADAADDLMRGGKLIAKFIYKSDEPADVKRLYADAPRLPIFQNVPGGPFYAFKSRLLAHFQALSDAKEREIAEAAALAAADLSPLPKIKPARSQPRKAIAKPVPAQSCAATRPRRRTPENHERAEEIA
jgi:hypothetical protein